MEIVCTVQSASVQGLVLPERHTSPVLHVYLCGLSSPERQEISGETCRIVWNNDDDDADGDGDKDTDTETPIEPVTVVLPTSTIELRSKSTLHITPSTVASLAIGFRLYVLCVNEDGEPCERCIGEAVLPLTRLLRSSGGGKSTVRLVSIPSGKHTVTELEVALVSTTPAIPPLTPTDEEHIRTTYPVYEIAEAYTRENSELRAQLQNTLQRLHRDIGDVDAAVQRNNLLPGHSLAPYARMDQFQTSFGTLPVAAYTLQMPEEAIDARVLIQLVYNTLKIYNVDSIRQASEMLQKSHSIGYCVLGHTISMIANQLPYLSDMEYTVGASILTSSKRTPRMTDSDDFSWPFYARRIPSGDCEDVTKAIQVVGEFWRQEKITRLDALKPEERDFITLCAKHLRRYVLFSALFLTSGAHVRENDNHTASDQYEQYNAHNAILMLPMLHTTRAILSALGDGKNAGFDMPSVLQTLRGPLKRYVDKHSQRETEQMQPIMILEGTGECHPILASAGNDAPKPLWNMPYDAVEAYAQQRGIARSLFDVLRKLLITDSGTFYRYFISGDCLGSRALLPRKLYRLLPQHDIMKVLFVGRNYKYGIRSHDILHSKDQWSLLPVSVVTDEQRAQMARMLSYFEPLHMPTFVKPNTQLLAEVRRHLEQCGYRPFDATQTSYLKTAGHNEVMYMIPASSLTPKRIAQLRELQNNAIGKSSGSYVIEQVPGVATYVRLIINNVREYAQEYWNAGERQDENSMHRARLAVNARRRNRRTDGDGESGGAPHRLRAPLELPVMVKCALPITQFISNTVSLHNVNLPLTETPDTTSSAQHGRDDSEGTEARSARAYEQCVRVLCQPSALLAASLYVRFVFDSLHLLQSDHTPTPTQYSEMHTQILFASALIAPPGTTVTVDMQQLVAIVLLLETLLDDTDYQQLKQQMEEQIALSVVDLHAKIHAAYQKIRSDAYLVYTPPPLMYNSELVQHVRDKLQTRCGVLVENELAEASWQQWTMHWRSYWTRMFEVSHLLCFHDVALYLAMYHQCTFQSLCAAVSLSAADQHERLRIDIFGRDYFFALTAYRNVYVRPEMQSSAGATLGADLNLWEMEHIGTLVRDVDLEQYMPAYFIDSKTSFAVRRTDESWFVPQGQQSTVADSEDPIASARYLSLRNMQSAAVEAATTADTVNLFNADSVQSLNPQWLQIKQWLWNAAYYMLQTLDSVSAELGRRALQHCPRWLFYLLARAWLQIYVRPMYVKHMQASSTAAAAAAPNDADDGDANENDDALATLNMVITPRNLSYVAQYHLKSVHPFVLKPCSRVTIDNHAAASAVGRQVVWLVFGPLRFYQCTRRGAPIDLARAPQHIAIGSSREIYILPANHCGSDVSAITFATLDNPQHDAAMNDTLVIRAEFLASHPDERRDNIPLFDPKMRSAFAGVHETPSRPRTRMITHSLLYDTFVQRMTGTLPTSGPVHNGHLQTEWCDALDVNPLQTSDALRFERLQQIFQTQPLLGSWLTLTKNVVMQTLLTTPDPVERLLLLRALQFSAGSLPWYLVAEQPLSNLVSLRGWIAMLKDRTLHTDTAPTVDRIVPMFTVFANTRQRAEYMCILNDLKNVFSPRADVARRARNAFACYNTDMTLSKLDVQLESPRQATAPHKLWIGDMVGEQLALPFWLHPNVLTDAAQMTRFAKITLVDMRTGGVKFDGNTGLMLVVSGSVRWNGGHCVDAGSWIIWRGSSTQQQHHHHHHHHHHHSQERERTSETDEQPEFFSGTSDSTQHPIVLCFDFEADALRAPFKQLTHCSVMFNSTPDRVWNSETLTHEIVEHCKKNAHFAKYDVLTAHEFNPSDPVGGDGTHVESASISAYWAALQCDTVHVPIVADPSHTSKLVIQTDPLDQASESVQVALHELTEMPRLLFNGNYTMQSVHINQVPEIVQAYADQWVLE